MKKLLPFRKVEIFIFYVAIIGMTILVNSCFENPTPPEVITAQVNSDPTSGVTAGGIIKSDGGSEIFEKGICYSLNQNPTISEVRIMVGYGSADFEVILPLIPETYYIRAYAVNGAGIGYGDVIFVTIEPLPIVNVFILDFGDITGATAFMRGRIESNQTINLRGACWSTTLNPTISNSKTEAGSGDGIFETTISNLNPGTTYYTRAYAVTAADVFYSDNYEFTTVAGPQLVTKEIINAGTFIISTGGDIMSGGQIMNAGVCWSTDPLPTIANDKTEDQLIYSSFYSDPQGLQPNTTYYLRAYATNIAGTGYGNEITITMPSSAVTDLDGNPYSADIIGEQTWLVENLRTTKYSNGDDIWNLTNPTDWQTTTSGAWSYYENDSHYEVPYGKLYNLFAVADTRNVCPTGWHVPNDGEWQTLINFVGGNEFAGNKMKETSTAHWKPNNDFSTNSSGFTALPGGARSNSTGISYPAISLGMFWSTTAFDDENAYGYYLFDAYQSISRQLYIKQTGLSVRCMQD